MLEEFVQIAHRLLVAEPENPAGVRAARVDPALNGLQVGRTGADVARIAFAVDACQETMQRAADWNADLLFVHHGLFWGRPLALTGTHLARVRLLLEHDLALYALHLPLDCHPTLGNNAGLADALGLQERAPFGEYRGVAIGIQGRLPEPLSLGVIADCLFGGEHNCLAVLPFGPERIERVALVSGGGTRDLDSAIAAGADLFVTGDASPRELPRRAGGRHPRGLRRPLPVGGIRRALGGEAAGRRSGRANHPDRRSDGTVSTYPAARQRRLLPLILVPVILLADQASKALAIANLAPGRPQEVIGDLLRLTLVHNPAIAFSIGHSLPEQLRRPLFLVLPLVVLVVILVYYLRTNDLSRFQRWLLAAVLGGGLANMVDRVFRPQGVVDFVDVKFYGLFGMERYPTFNVADSSVVVAGILLLVTFLGAELRAHRRDTP